MCLMFGTAGKKNTEVLINFVRETLSFTVAPIPSKRGERFVSINLAYQTQ